MVNYLTKVAKREPIKSSQDAETVASIFFNWWLCQHGGPKSVHIRLFTKPCKSLRILKIRTTPGHLQGKRQVRRTNCTFMGLLKASTKEAQPEDLDVRLGRAILAYQVTVYISNGASTFQTLTNCEIRIPSKIFPPNKETETENAL